MFSDGLFVDSNGNSCIASVLPFCRLDFVCAGMAASLCFIGMYGGWLDFTFSVIR